MSVSNFVIDFVLDPDRSVNYYLIPKLQLSKWGQPNMLRKVKALPDIVQYTY